MASPALALSCVLTAAVPLSALTKGKATHLRVVSSDSSPLPPFCRHPQNPQARRQQSPQQQPVEFLKSQFCSHIL